MVTGAGRWEGETDNSQGSGTIRCGQREYERGEYIPRTDGSIHGTKDLGSFHSIHLGNRPTSP